MGLVTQAQLSLWNLDRGAISADVLVVITITKYLQRPQQVCVAYDISAAARRGGCVNYLSPKRHGVEGKQNLYK